MTTPPGGGLRHEDDDDKFVIIPRPTIRNTALSFRARGLLAFLADLPAGWDVNATWLVKQGREGREAIYAALIELRAAGHYRVEKRRAEAGRWVTGTAVSKVARPSWAAEYAEQEAARKARREEPVPVYDPPPATDGETLTTPTDLRVSVHREPDVRLADVRNPVGLKEERGRSTDKELSLPSGESTPAAEDAQLPIVAPAGDTEQPTKRKRKVGVPDDWQPDGRLCAWTSEQAPGMPRSEVAAFIAYHQAHGNTFVRLDRAWQTWVHRWLGRSGRGGGGPNRPGPYRDDGWKDGSSAASWDRLKETGGQDR